MASGLKAIFFHPWLDAQLREGLLLADICLLAHAAERCDGTRPGRESGLTSGVEVQKNGHLQGARFDLR